MHAAEQLKRALRARPESYRDIAERAGLSRSILTSFTTNRRGLRAENLDRVAKAIGCRFVLVNLDESDFDPPKTGRKRTRHSRPETRKPREKRSTT